VGNLSRLRFDPMIRTSPVSTSNWIQYVMYIGSLPGFVKNDAYRAQQAAAFSRGETPPEPVAQTALLIPPQGRSLPIPAA